MRAVPRLCELYPGICITTEEKARENIFTWKNLGGLVAKVEARR
jgi:hypothetical protein